MVKYIAFKHRGAANKYMEREAKKCGAFLIFRLFSENNLVFSIARVMFFGSPHVRRYHTRKFVKESKWLYKIILLNIKLENNNYKKNHSKWLIILSATRKELA